MIKPMLAHKWDPKRITFPCHVQPKLNGVRGIYVPHKHFQSRYGEVWSYDVIAHAFDVLNAFDLHFDGEFYKHGMSLQQINSRIGVVRGEPHNESHKIKFHIFDVMVRAPFVQRAAYLAKLAEQLAGNEFVEVVPTMQITSSIEADHWYNHWKNLEGYEGMMYRDSNAVYGFSDMCGNKDNRWHCLMKRKGVQDLYATVIGLNEMHEQSSGLPKGTLGSFQLRTESGHVFNAGSGLTDALRAKFWSLQDKLLGVRVRIVYEMLSDGGVPLKPIVECVEYVD